MRTILPILLFSFLQITTIAQQTIYGSITHDGLQRDFILYVPPIYDPEVAAPLVLNFHGYTSNATEQMFYGDFRPIADTAGFIVVHPMGTEDLIGNPHWNVGWGLSTVDDVGFTTALIDSLSAIYSINQDRIYSTGMSNGGFMSYRLACELSERIAAIASVTGTMNVTQLNTCDPTHPMPVMEIHGTADGTVAYEGNVLFASTASVVDFWAEFNACDTPPAISPIDDIDPTDGCTAEHQVFSNGNRGATVEHFKIIGGGHTWPGSAFVQGVTNNDIDASNEIWRFFSAYDIHGLIDSTSAASDIYAEQVRIYPNPAGAFVSVEKYDDLTTHYFLSTMFGQSLQSGVLHSNHQQIDLSMLTPGMYVLQVGQQVIKVIKAEN